MGRGGFSLVIPRSIRRYLKKRILKQNLGLVIQEYGYRGQPGQPKMDFTPRARPSG